MFRVNYKALTDRGLADVLQLDLNITTRQPQGAHNGGTIVVLGIAYQREGYTNKYVDNARPNPLFSRLMGVNLFRT